jgi:hypothetical protein
MEQRGRFVLAALVLGAGAVFFVGLTVYPYQYGVVESGLLVGVLVVFGLVETVLDDAMV